MRSILLIIAFILILVVLRLTVFSGNEKSAPAKGPGGMPAGVEAIVATESEFGPKLKVAGSLIASEHVELMPEMSGKIIFLQMNEGQKVQKGDLLLKLNSSEWEAQLAKAEASVQLFQTNLNRQSELLKVQGVSEQERDQTLQALQTAQADATYYRAMLAKCEVRAPFTGVLGLRGVSEGAIVSPQTVLGTLYKTDRLKLDFSVPERYAGLLKPPFDVVFNVQGDTISHQARVYASEPAASTDNRSIRLRAEMDNSRGELIPGRFADVSVPLSREDRVVMLPTQCIVPVLKGQQVWISKNGKAKSVRVETGYRSDAYVEIRTGVAPGDTVITSGIMSIREGADLKIKINNSAVNATKP